MAAAYLEIKKNNDSVTRTLVRTCHNYKNVALVKEMFDENTGLWRIDNNFIIPVNYIKPIVDYTKQHDIFQLTKTPEKNSTVIDSPYSPRYYGCNTPIKTKTGEDLKKLSKRTRMLFEVYDHDCIEIWESQLGQLAEEEQISQFWAFDQSSQLDNDSTRTPEKRLPLLSNNFSDEDETLSTSKSLLRSTKEGRQTLSPLKHFVKVCKIS